MLELQSLTKRYRGIPAIESVSFSVGAGEIVGYLGPNGSGKSTTVKIITGILQPNDGRVLFEGKNILEDLVGFRAAFGYVPEEAHVYTYLTGLEYLQLVGRLRGMGERLIELKATELLKLLALDSWRHSPISLYSKGMKQRVLIAAALMLVEQICNRVIVIARGRIVADAAPDELTRLMELPNLEKVFAQLVQQQDTRAVARELLEVMRVTHA